MSEEKCPFCKDEHRRYGGGLGTDLWKCGTLKVRGGVSSAIRDKNCYEREIAALKAALGKIGTINDKYVALGLQWAAEKLSGDAIAAGLSLGLAEISAVLEGLKKEGGADEPDAD